MAKRLLDCEEVGERLQLSARTVRDMVREGELPGYRLRWGYRIDEKQLDRWLEGRTATNQRG